jgi:(p)ppGpp synthase/HD superfamily hydrolase
LALLPQRILDVCWKENGEDENGNFSSRISIIVKNESGAFADFASIVAKRSVNITDFKTINRSADYIESVATLDVKNLDHLEEIMSALRISKKVVEVKRV